jgi:hypothetical protein
MTIARLYEHLQSTNFNTLSSAERINRVYWNPIVTISSREEAEEYEFCIIHVPNEIISRATHCWALELSYTGRVPANHPMVHYLAAQLLDGYNRWNAKDEIKKALEALPTRIDKFWKTPLRTTIIQVLTDIRTEEARTVVAGEQELIPTAAHTQCQLVDSDDDTHSLTFGEQETHDGRTITLWMRNSRRSQRFAAVSFKDTIRFCKENMMFRWKMYDPTTGKHTVTYADPVKARKIREILEAKPGPQQESCHSCKSSVGEFSCGAEHCKYRLCGNCFVAWYKKNNKCPECDSNYIPIATRA